MKKDVYLYEFDYRFTFYDKDKNVKLVVCDVAQCCGLNKIDAIKWLKNNILFVLRKRKNIDLQDVDVSQYNVVCCNIKKICHLLTFGGNVDE